MKIQDVCLVLSNKADFPIQYRTDDEIELFKDFIVSQGGSKKTVLDVRGVSHKASKLSHGYFAAELRKRIIKNVSSFSFIGLDESPPIFTELSCFSNHNSWAFVETKLFIF